MTANRLTWDFWAALASRAVTGISLSLPAAVWGQELFAPSGRKYSRTDYVDSANQPMVKHWIVHGAQIRSQRSEHEAAKRPNARSELTRFGRNVGP